MDPESPPSNPTPGFFTGLRPGAVAIGAVVDSLATLLLGTLLRASILSDAGVDPAQVDRELLASALQSPESLAAFAAMGTLCTALGGFVAGRLGGTQRGQHGAMVGLVGIVLSLLTYGSPPVAAPPPLWYDLLGFAALVPAGALGGWLSRFGARSDAEPAAGERGEQP